MNFAKYWAFVLGLTKWHRAGGLLLAVLFCPCTTGGRLGGVAPFGAHLNGALKTAGARGRWRTVSEDGLATSLGLGEAFFTEKYGRTDYGLQDSAISAQPICVRAFYADRWEPRARAEHFSRTASAERRTLHG